MDKIEELFPQLVEYLKEDLAKENLNPKNESRRLELIGLTEKAFRDSAAKKINAKYEHPQPTDEASAQRRSAIFRGNILPTPFAPSSVDAKPKDDCNNDATKRASQISIAAYEALSSYQIPASSVYEEVGLVKRSDDNDVTSEPANNIPTYEDPASFIFATERIAEASNSESGTDYEEYGNEDEKYNKESADPRVKKVKKNVKVRREVSLSSLRFSGSLHQKGSFHQHRRRFCGIRGETFVCCKGDSTLKVAGKVEAPSFKVVLELALGEYEVVHQERRDAKSSYYSQELRFSCPGKETHLFYADSKQDAENWVKELRKAAPLSKKDSFEINADDVTSLTDNYDNESENSETNISGGSVDKNSMAKILGQQQPAGDDARGKKSKLQTILVTVGKKLGNKTKTLLQQAADFGNPQQMDGKPDSGGYLSIRSEEYTGDRWFKRFCRIEDGRLNCYKDQETMDARPEFSLVLKDAQLKHIGGKDELKVTIVKNEMEHCLKMDNFMEHGKWLMSLIHETGFARQLAEASKMSPLKDYPQDPASFYEEVGKFFTLDDVTLDESCPDDAPPPLPDWSPPASPCVGEDFSSGKKAGGGGGGGESIYLEPAGWLKDVEEIKKKKTPRKYQYASVVKKEESLYINRDFLIPEDKKSKEKRKDGQKDKSPMVASNSFPSLVSVGLAEANNGNEAKRGGGGGVVKRNDVTSDPSKQQQQQRFRPSSALIEYPENLSEMKIGDKKNIRGREMNISLAKSTKGAKSENKDSASSSASDQERKQEGCKVKTSHSYRDIVGYDMNRINRSRRTDSVSSEDLSSSTLLSDYTMNSKKMVQDLVKMFERST